MDLELLLQRCLQLGLVLRLSLCSENLRCVTAPTRSSSNETDLRGLGELNFDFNLGKPFTPYQQLMGVLPEESKEHVPAAYRVCNVSLSRLTLMCRTS